MSKEITEPEVIEESEHQEAFKILDKAIEKLQKEEMIEKANQQKDTKIDITEPEIDRELQIKEFTTYFDFIFEFLFTFINPLLKKENIEVISKEEIKDLKESILGYITDKLIGSTTTKMTQFFSKIVDIPKLIKLVVSIWKIFYPRITKFFDKKKNKIPDSDIS